MISIALGKIAVPTPGTPVPITLTAAQQALLPPSGCVHKIEAWADTADTGTSIVKDVATGNKLASLPAPANGHTEHWETSRKGNWLNPIAFEFDAVTANQGPLVTLWVV
jgi:hypothetical protein